MIAGTAYGVVLNDRAEIALLGSALDADPYKVPPRAPVVYIKPRNCLTSGGAPVVLEADVPSASVAATIALIFDRDVSGAGGDVLSAVGSACLAVDVSVPHESYYRPAIAQRCRDGFLPLGRVTALPANLGVTELVTEIDGRIAHRWSLDRLVRSVPELIGDLAAFMTLRAGDMLLVGLPGDAPVVSAGASVTVSADGFPALNVRFVSEVLA